MEPAPCAPVGEEEITALTTALGPEAVKVPDADGVELLAAVELLAQPPELPLTLD